MNSKSLFWLLITVLLITVSPAQTEQTRKVPRIGYLTLRPGPFDQDKIFKQELHDLGWIEGRNLAIEYGWAAGKVDRLPAFAKELVDLKVDLIVASATPSVQ